MNNFILFTNSYKHKYTCIRTYKHNTEKISSETDRILKPRLELMVHGGSQSQWRHEQTVLQQVVGLFLQTGEYQK